MDGALPMRFALALLPLIGDAAGAGGRPRLRGAGRARRLVPLAVGAALLPLFPAPLPTADRPPVPEFVTGGHWRQCVRPGGVLVPVPLPTPKEPVADALGDRGGRRVRHAGGLLHRPVRARAARAAMGTYKRPTSALLADVARRGDRRPIGDGSAARPHGTPLLGCLLRRAGRRRPARRESARTLEQLSARPPGSPTPGPGASDATRGGRSSLRPRKGPSRWQGPFPDRSDARRADRLGRLDELLARVVQLPQRDHLTLEDERQRPVDHHPDLAVERRDPAHVVRPVHEPRRPAASS